jgi:hypothetical protein
MQMLFILITFKFHETSNQYMKYNLIFSGIQEKVAANKKEVTV